MNDTAEIETVVDRDETALAIAEPMDIARAREIVMSEPRSLLPAPIEELEQMASIIAYGGTAPVAMQGKPERCIGIAYQAALRRVDPVAFASECYIMPVKGGGERLCFQSKLIKALIQRDVEFEPGQGLRIEYFGEKAQRYAVARGTPKGEGRELIYSSPIIGQITPKNSPLWVTDPDLQLDYFASQRWARKYRPSVIMGMYSPDEMPLLARDDGEPRQDPYAPAGDDEAEVSASASSGQKTKADVDVSSQPPPSGGAGVLIKDKVQPADKRDLGENPWPDVEDVMEWAEGFKIEIEEQPDREALAKLFDRAKGHGLLPRLKTASSTDFDAVIDLINDKNAELKKAEDEAFPGDKA